MTLAQKIIKNFIIQRATVMLMMMMMMFGSLRHDWKRAC